MNYRFPHTTSLLETGNDMNRVWKATLALLILLAASCGSFEPGRPMPMDGDDVSHEVEKISFTVPAGFEFTQGITYAEFVGQPAWSARFDAPTESDGLAITAANPSYPPFRPAACGTTTKTSWAALGFTCESEMLFTSRPPHGRADAVSVMFTRGAHGSSLYISSEGH